MPEATSLKPLAADNGELLIGHEEIADSVNQTQHNHQRRKEPQQNQVENSPADLPEIEAVRAQPAQADGQNDGDFAMVGRAAELFIALAEHPPTDRYGERNGQQHFSGVGRKVVVQTGVQIGKVMHHPAGQPGQPSIELSQQGVAEGQGQQNGQKDGRDQYGSLQHGASLFQSVQA